jgi:Domain of unknown function (DUF4956)
MFAIYADYGIDLVVDVAAIFLLAYVLYYRRHRRADLLLAYVALNIGIFIAMSLLGKVRVDIALGFGLFAILSIIRLRSTSVTQQEVAYYFVALVMGLVNGLDIDDRRLVVAVNLLLLATMAVVDSRHLRERARRMDVHLDVIHADDAALVADLERRLGGTVMYHEINDIDYVNQTMAVDVRYRVGTTPVVPEVDLRQLKVTLDVIHSTEAALVADLERRLGGRVLSHEIKDVDYVRDTMDVKVTYRVWNPVAAPAAAPNQGRPAAQLPAPQTATPMRPQAQPARPQSNGGQSNGAQSNGVQPQRNGRGTDERTVVVK